MTALAVAKSLGTYRKGFDAVLIRPHQLFGQPGRGGEVGGGFALFVSITALLSNQTLSSSNSQQDNYKVMEPGPSNSQRFEGRRSEQREIFMERIKALRNVPRSGNSGTATNSSGKESSTANFLPSFGNLSAYQIHRDKESALFDLEVARLLDGLEASNLLLEDHATIRFPDQTYPDHWCTHLSPLLRTLMCSLVISALDDITVLRAHKIKFNVHNAVISYAGQRVQECQIDTRALGYTRIIHPSSYRDPRNPRRIDLESTSSISDSQAAGYYAIVDYITAIAARLLASGFQDEPAHAHKPSWHAMTLTTLAKVSAKMKVLGHRLSDFKIQVDGDSTSGHAPKSQDRLPLEEPPLPSNSSLVSKSQGQPPPGILRFPLPPGSPPPPPPPPVHPANTRITPTSPFATHTSHNIHTTLTIKCSALVTPTISITATATATAINETANAHSGELVNGVSRYNLYF
ncbi:hypothetical protein K456DRAFT_35888 [Colletotrichum gloeosporioides 23]|nr:hypothetical protein K456DRAFT_35888 [Colletotrichum gloeosporioides 23]